ncbi:hypothetical protein M409DRAFT_30648 [Zasmidium cellare ATCC 36951]|uniref:Uncharacterized protein n=1 Tax=Zasmidium cellare ATCC 36951 TaxID=1080233 RepID=A0A6A6BVQ6_ZASCE|nr:uncharacterized protein M409DRAFT_30648 [Zasmidium cellare ATCC 36951]KAF2158861.1 hypothetical protein M409DRAFT_30648 [Zasmidium cellare ATCC 36951]
MSDKILIPVLLPLNILVALHDNKISTIFDAVEAGAKSESAKGQKIVETRSNSAPESFSVKVWDLEDITGGAKIPQIDESTTQRRRARAVERVFGREMEMLQLSCNDRCL